MKITPETAVCEAEGAPLWNLRKFKTPKDNGQGQNSPNHPTVAPLATATIKLIIKVFQLRQGNPQDDFA